MLMSYNLRKSDEIFVHLSIYQTSHLVLILVTYNHRKPSQKAL